MRITLLVLASLLTASCDRSDYVIELKRGHVESVTRVGGSGYLVVDKASADTLDQSGDVYVDGRSCLDDRCRTIPVGSLRKDNRVPVQDGVGLKLVPLYISEPDERYPPFWLKGIACFRIEAVKGMLGRTGRSNWNCSVTSKKT